MNSIEIEKLNRIYISTIGVFKRSRKEIIAVDNISVSISSGELFGLLGPNGAGKTTTIKMLTTLLLPTSGRAMVAGFDVVKASKEVQRRIGFIFGGERGLYWRLSGENNLRYFASLYHVPPEISKKRIPELLELVGLKGRENEKVEGYSRGMKQRLHVARTLLHDPPVLFLDEPTIGLDPVGAREFRQVIQGLKNQGKTILLTTHYMYEADLLCDRIAVITRGKIVASGSPGKLKETVRDLHVVELEAFGLPAEAIEAVRNLKGVDAVSLQNRDQKQALIIQNSQGPGAVPGILAALEGYRLGKVQTREPTLEDAYVRLVGSEGEGL